MRYIVLVFCFIFLECTNSTESAGASGAGNPSPNVVNARVNLQLKPQSAARITVENKDFVQSIFVKIFYLQIISKINNRSVPYHSEPIEQDILGNTEDNFLELPTGVYHNIHIKFNSSKSNPSVIIKLFDADFGVFDVEIEYRDLVQIAGLQTEATLDNNSKKVLNINFPHGEWENISFWKECFSKAQDNRILTSSHAEPLCSEAVIALGEQIKDGIEWEFMAE